MRKCWWIATLLLVAGCEEQQSTAGYAQMAGVNDITRVGDLLFITSTNRSELRVLDTVPDVAQNRKDADYVRAPNPLEYLSIPVVDRPISLHTDTRYDPDADPAKKGQELPGNYVFVRGSGATEVSIVGAARDQLTELIRLPTDGPVTALAAHGSVVQQDATSMLFFAESVAGDPKVMVLEVPKPSELSRMEPNVLKARAVPVSDAVGVPLRFLGQDGAPESVVALTVMPRLSTTEGWRLAVATRSAQGGTGHAYLLALDATGTREEAARVELNFGGPVRALMTHPAGQSSKDFPGLPAGARVFGILDEGSCPSAAECGIVAVDAMTGPLGGTRPDAAIGQRSKDLTKRTMFPIHLGSTLIQGVTFGAGMPIVGGLLSLSLGGVVTGSNGAIAIFDADALQHNDLGGAPAMVSGSMNLLKEDGTAIYTTEEARTVALDSIADGLLGDLAPALSERLIPDAENLALRPTTSLVVDAQAFPLVRVGDVVQPLKSVTVHKDAQGHVLTDALGKDIITTSACGDPLSITALDPATSTLTLEKSIPSDVSCKYYSVRRNPLKKGVTRESEEVRLTYQGELTGLTKVALSEPGMNGVADKGGQILRLGAELAARVRPQDPVVFFNQDAACGPTGVTITAVDAETATLSGAIPAGCTSLTVGIGTEKPWVMTGSISGYLGRVAPGARTGPDAVKGTYFFHPNEIDESAPAIDFLFQLPVNLKPDAVEGSPDIKLVRGMYLKFVTDSGYSPFIFEAVRSNNTADFLLPGGVTFVKQLTDPIDVPARVYVAYPSANGLFEFRPGGAQFGANTVNGLYYR
ncbi:MAG: hypothetical protein L0Y66_24775 [Myxococcaceae bacterium]|nr:hypothetical protein [Myxococcaceae bacterium]